MKISTGSKSTRADSGGVRVVTTGHALAQCGKFLALAALLSCGAGSPGFGQTSATKAVAIMSDYARCTEVVSGGFVNGNCVRIKIGDHVFFDSRRLGPASAGLYAVAVHEHKVLLQAHYNTFTAPGACQGLLQDLTSLPDGTFVVVAAKDEPTRYFDAQGQAALNIIGAQSGLQDARPRTSYFCIGAKGLRPGTAIEKAGMEELRYAGPDLGRKVPLVFPEPPAPQVSSSPGIHEGLKIGETEAIYYIPRNFNRASAEYFFCIHGAGAWHRPGAMTHIRQFQAIADRRNLILVAPAFDCVFNRPLDREKDFAPQGNLRDPKLIRDWYLWDFVALLGRGSEQRSDLRLLEIFDCFSRHLMKREKFHLYGHSGGAQFVCRFVLFHPEVVDTAAASSSGTFTFPRCDKDYPWGLGMDNLGKDFGQQVRTEGMKLTPAEFDDKIFRMLALKMFLIVGADETWEDHPDLAWQGKSTLDKTRSYYEALKQEHARRLLAGQPLPRTFPWELHILPGVGHDSRASGIKAGELLFP